MAASRLMGWSVAAWDYTMCAVKSLSSHRYYEPVIYFALCYNCVCVLCVCTFMLVYTFYILFEMFTIICFFLYFTGAGVVQW